MSIPGVDGSTVFGGLSLTAIICAIAVPLWKKFLAQQELGTNHAQGEIGWMQRQASEITTQKQMVEELLKLRTLDAEIIASLKLEKALAYERTERLVARMKRMENVLCELKPEYAKWIRSDFIEIGPPVFYPPTL